MIKEMLKNKKLTVYINILFKLFWCVTFLVYLVESITYSGFVIKHTGIDPRLLLVILLIFSFLELMSKIKTRKKADFLIYLFKCFLFFGFAALYVILKVANRFLYPNFVFSKIHVQPDNLFWVCVVALLPFLVATIQKISWDKLRRLPFILSFLSISLIGYNIFKIYKTEYWAYQFILTHPKATYDEKMRRAVGSVFYNLTQFINKHSSENSYILLPPQAFPWPESGNGAFIRYFIYPRIVGNGQEAEAPDKESIKIIDYIVINWGETDSTQGSYTHGWPKFDVSAEKYWLMNEDGSLQQEIEGDFKYKDFEGRKVWGLIKVKH